MVEGDKIFCESELISWYIAEKFETGTKLIPEKMDDRLKMRMFIGNFAPKVANLINSPWNWKYKS